MLQVRLDDTAEDSQLRFAVMISHYQGQWVFCRHKERGTWECPGGRRENGETIEETARRELFEETGAVDFSLRQVGAYSVCGDGQEPSYGMLYTAEIQKLGEKPESEIAEIRCQKELPDRWTYPDIQPILLKWAQEQRAQGCLPPGGGHRKI